MADCEIIFARSERQWRVALQFTPPITLAQVLQASGLFADCPQLLAQSDDGSAGVQRLNVERYTLAVRGEQRALEMQVHDGDRIEILRALRADPKDARREVVARDRARRGLKTWRKPPAKQT